MPMNILKPILFCFLALVAVLALETWTNIDIYVQNLCYNETQREWLINPIRHKELSFIFYDDLKRALVFFAVICLLNVLLSFKMKRLHQHNHFCLTMLLCFIVIPCLVAGAKYFTNVYCPYQLNIYNGLYPFVRILETYPQDFIQPKIGKCFPAGHATAGFAFIGLYYAFRQERWKIFGLIIGLGLGLTAGIYQMLRGQHFLSHTLFSMFAALLLAYIVHLIVLKTEKKFPHFFK